LFAIWVFYQQETYQIAVLPIDAADGRRFNA